MLCAQEYFSIPLSSLKSVLSAAPVTTVRLILQYYTRNKDTLQVDGNFLFYMHATTSFRSDIQYCIHANRVASVFQLPDEYLSTAVSVLFQTHLLKDGGLFPDLAPLLAEATTADINALPSLQNNLSVYVTESGSQQHTTYYFCFPICLVYSYITPQTECSHSIQLLCKVM